MMPMYLNKDKMQDFIDMIAAPQVTAISGTVVTVTHRVDGKLVVRDAFTLDREYTSGYWESQPDGEYELIMNQGGIFNRNIPREEKVKLVNFLSHHFDNKHPFAGLVKLENSKGRISQVRIEPKI